MEDNFKKREAILSKASTNALEKEILERKIIRRENSTRRTLNTETKTFAHFIVPLNIPIPRSWLSHFLEFAQINNLSRRWGSRD